jgi:hypothetical protein
MNHNLFELKKGLKIQGPILYFENTDTWEEFCNFDNKNNKKKKSFLHIFFLKKKKDLKIKREINNINNRDSWDQYCKIYKKY